MGIAKSDTGSYDILVIAFNADGERYEAAQEYSIDISGVHVLTREGEQHFIPLWNIRKLTIREHVDIGGGWK